MKNREEIIGDALYRDNAGGIQGRLQEYIGSYTAVNKFLYDKVWSKNEGELSLPDKKFLRALLIKKLTAYHYLMDPFIHDFDITYSQLQEITSENRPEMNRCTGSSIFGEGKSLNRLHNRVKKNYFDIILDEEDPEFGIHPGVDSDKLLSEFVGNDNYDIYIPGRTNISTCFNTPIQDDEGCIEDIGITLGKYPFI